MHLKVWHLAFVGKTADANNSDRKIMMKLSESQKHKMRRVL